MFFLFRVIIVFLLCATFVIIFVTSFFYEAQYFDTPNIAVDSQNLVENLNYSSGTIETQVLSSFETIMSNTNLPTVISSDGEVGLDVSQAGKYITSLRDLRKKYSFEGKGYKITQEGIGEVFIDSQTKSGKVFVMPLNTPITITLRSEDASEEYTDIFLHPHMYLVFQPSRGSFLKNADALRVETVYTLGYLGSPISKIDTDVFVKQYSDSKESFLQVGLKYIGGQDSLYAEKLKGFLSRETAQIGGYNMVKRYMYFFINTEKKRIFYKNIILSSLSQIMKTQTYDQDLVDQTLKDFEVLRSIDVDSYNELFMLKEEYISILNANTGGNFIAPKMMFYALDNQGLNEQLVFPLASFSLFSHYDDTGEFSRDIETFFLESFRTSTNQEEDTMKKTLRYQYFSYLLQEQLKHILDESKQDFSVASFIDILTNHIDIIELFYDTEKNTRISMLYVYNDILEKIHIFVRGRYFVGGRDENGLLKYNSKNKIQGTEVIALRAQLERIFTMYEKNSKFLSETSSRDKAIITGILESKEKIIEYLSALENYESYVSEYDVSKKNLLNINTFGSQQDKSLNESKLRLYLKQFIDLSLDNATIEVGQKYYTVKNAYIRGKLFDFTLYPEAANKIDSITINGVTTPFVYKLDLIELDWDEKYKLLSKEEKEMYDFKNFFVITFFTNDLQQIEEFQTIIAGPNEDKTEIVFKRDILLGPKGEFSSIRSILPLEYKNIRVKKDKELYDIFIESAALSFGGIQGMNEGSYQAVMDAQYVLSDDDHYFENIELRVYAGTETNIGPVFENTQIQITGRVQLVDFSTRIESVFSNIGSYVSLYRSLKDNYQAENIFMQYSSRMKKMTFKFDLEEKKYTILSSGDTIDTIYSGTRKLTDNAVPIGDLRNYLQ